MRRNWFVTHKKDAKDNSEGKLLRTKFKTKQIQRTSKMVHVCMVKLVEMRMREAEGQKRSTHFFYFQSTHFFVLPLFSFSMCIAYERSWGTKARISYKEQNGLREDNGSRGHHKLSVP